MKPKFKVGDRVTIEGRVTHVFTNAYCVQFAKECHLTVFHNHGVVAELSHAKLVRKKGKVKRNA